MGIPAPTELLLILAIVALIFGGKKIPELMDGVAKGIKTFKRSMESDDTPAPPQAAHPPLPPQGSEEAKESQLAGPKVE